MADPVASIVITVRGEPRQRLTRLLDLLGDQDVGGTIEVLLAVEPQELPALRDLVPSGAVDRVELVENPGGERSTGLNRAVAAAAAPVICRLDARSRPGPDHVRKCVERLAVDPRVGVVGGSQCPRPADASAAARGIARALANPWLLGAPEYRRPGRSGSVDTVYLGCFRGDELIEIGGYETRLAANEDFELAQRYRGSGRLVWLEDGLSVGYEARASVREVGRQYVAFGRSKVRYWRLAAERPNRRQLAALTTGASVLAVAAASVTRPARLSGLVLLVTVGLAALDHLGGIDEPELGVRLWSIAASAAVAGGWLAGVAVEAALSPRRTAGAELTAAAVGADEAAPQDRLGAAPMTDGG